MFAMASRWYSGIAMHPSILFGTHELAELVLGQMRDGRILTTVRQHSEHT